MATKILSASGTVSILYTEKEQNETLSQFAAFDKVLENQNHKFYAGNCKGIELWYSATETEIGFEKYEKTITANGITVKFKCNICNENEKTYNAVRKCYGIN